MLVEVARLFADLGFYDEAEPPAFHIHGVTGPDEYTAIVDDNLYTNVMARFTLRFAADVVTRLRAEHPRRCPVDDDRRKPRLPKRRYGTISST
jgi:alpha,alpha-trehalose phosphorylase